jgi:hypothetical protein
MFSRYQPPATPQKLPLFKSNLCICVRSFLYRHQKQEQVVTHKARQMELPLQTGSIYIQIDTASQVHRHVMMSWNTWQTNRVDNIHTIGWSAQQPGRRRTHKLTENDARRHRNKPEKGFSNWTPFSKKLVQVIVEGNRPWQVHRSR